MRARLRAQDPSDRRKKSAAIQRKLFSLGAFKKARCVCFYVSTAQEVNTTRMIDRALARGQRVLVPKADLKTMRLDLYEITSRNSLWKGALGILEGHPTRHRRADPGEINCVAVPGLVFDEEGHRLGRGKAFYDRFLAKLGSRVFKVGLAFSFQKVKKIPRESHDVPMDVVVTD